MVAYPTIRHAVDGTAGMTRIPTYGLVRPGRCCTEGLRRLCGWVLDPARALYPRVVASNRDQRNCWAHAAPCVA